jgi:hypothetical protein
MWLILKAGTSCSPGTHPPRQSRQTNNLFLSAPKLSICSSKVITSPVGMFVASKSTAHA